MDVKEKTGCNEELDFDEETDMFEYIMKTIRQAKNYKRFEEALEKLCEAQEELQETDPEPDEQASVPDAQ